MIVYRCLSSNEILGMINGEQYRTYTVAGGNTFRYNKDTEYKHFFHFAEHAEYYQKERGKRIYPVIGQYVIPDEIIDQHGFGFYNNVKTMRNNGLSSYSMPLPEIIVNTMFIDNSYLYKIESELYSDFVTNRLNGKDNERYNEPICDYYLYDGNGRHGTNGYLDYSYAEIYYEMVYKYAKESHMDLEKFLNKIDLLNLKEQIETFFESNPNSFKNQTKQYLKEQKKKVN